ncbi:unnamed protein product [Coffea canephora]|uniref:RWD domain-containing protein n=2 Tax=Coffea TaxID=13442 RepID=A0A068UMF0_COFCA|nr:E3 ubiquitin-protein ligase RNF25-like [Coffea arabica]XP_027113390.1 E3 ubiquitin-protein ligase RNF25-like [Coffea arabica]CDP09429.1 unnamed protein product [Coffea canephora]
MAASEEEVAAELEAVEAVYSQDSYILRNYPPHLHIQVKPRTADVSSQQFVEAIIGIQATSKYPDEPPIISIVDSKGLDDVRQNQLIASIRDKAIELSSCLMLVALCEEAVEKLSSMNHPDGDCPLCLNPLLDEKDGNDSLPFMKLMSCFHCFHCECIIRWWNWLQAQKELDHANASCSVTSIKDMEDQEGMCEITEERMGECPVCRKVFLAKDIEHVLDLVGTDYHLSSSGTESVDEDNLLQSYSEKSRRQKYEAILKLQKENDGLIEPKKHEVLLPGMFLPRSAPPSSISSEKETDGQQSEDGVVGSGATPSVPSNRPSTSKHRNFSGRKHSHRGRSSGKHARRWIQKENGAAN